MKKMPLVAVFGILCLWLVSGQNRPDALEMYKAGEFLKAIETCKNELKEMPRNMDSYVVMGWSLVSLKRYQEALDESLKALQIDPNDRRVIKTAGEALYYLGKNKEALNYFERFISLDPQNAKIADVYYLLGEIYIRLGEYNNADIALTTALYQNGQNSAWWVRLGYAREMARDYKYALEAYQKALSISPNMQDAIRGIDSVKKKQTVE